MPDNKTVTFDALRRAFEKEHDMLALEWSPLGFYEDTRTQAYWEGAVWAAEHTPAAQSAGQEAVAHIATRKMDGERFLVWPNNVASYKKYTDDFDVVDLYATPVNGGEREAAYEPYLASDFTKLVAENAGLKLNVQRLEKQLLELNEELHVADLEREHFGDPDKRTGIYAERAADAQKSDVNGGERALDLLATLFDAYENGIPCYEDPSEQAGFVGNAVRLDNETFHACADLLNLHRPRDSERAADAPQVTAINAELLEALDSLLTDVGRASSLRGAVKARAALAKARGDA